MTSGVKGRERMMMLGRDRLEEALDLVDCDARPLDRAVARWLFRGRPVRDAADELRKLQNNEGGFGHGLEPDLELVESSVLATTIGRQHAMIPRSWMRSKWPRGRCRPSPRAQWTCTSSSVGSGGPPLSGRRLALGDGTPADGGERYCGARCARVGGVGCQAALPGACPRFAPRSCRGLADQRELGAGDSPAGH